MKDLIDSSLSVFGTEGRLHKKKERERKINKGVVLFIVSFLNYSELHSVIETFLSVAFSFSTACTYLLHIHARSKPSTLNASLFSCGRFLGQLA